MRYTIIAALACACAFAQTATVIVIDKNDAAATKQKYEAYMNAKAEYEKAEAALKERYKVTERQGFGCGVIFTPDFLLGIPAECPSRSLLGGTITTPLYTYTPGGPVVATNPN